MRSNLTEEIIRLRVIVHRWGLDQASRVGQRAAMDVRQIGGEPCLREPLSMNHYSPSTKLRHSDIWINERIKIHQLPLRLRGEGWGGGISNEPLSAHPSLFLVLNVALYPVGGAPPEAIEGLVIDAVQTIQLDMAGLDLVAKAVHQSRILVFMEASVACGKDQHLRSGMTEDQQVGGGSE